MAIELAANLSFLFQERHLLDRMSAAASCGFKAVEFGGGLLTCPKKDLVAAREKAGVEVAVLCCPAASMDKCTMGLASLPGREDGFRADLATAIDLALSLACKKIHVVASRSDSHDKSSEETYVSNLRLAAEECQKHNIQVLIEPISTVSDYYLQTYSQALDILKKVGHHNLKIEFDFYHAQRTQGNLLEFIRENLGSIGHIQVAQVPGRHEPDQEGEINYQYVFKALREMGYSGWIGAEYHPRGKTEDGLAWMSSIN